MNDLITKPNIDTRVQQVQKALSPPANDVQLIQVAMIRPHRDCIYAPSRLNPELITITKEDFNRLNVRPIKVSFADDGVSDPVTLPGYAYGWSCWYIEVKDGRLLVPPRS